MRIMALVLAGALAVCFINPTSAATRQSAVAAANAAAANAAAANPDRSVYPASRGCTAYC